MVRKLLINSLRVQNYRSIADSGELELGPATIIIGRNNSGKSALLRGLCCSQQGVNPTTADYRLQSDVITVVVELSPEGASRFITPDHEGVPIDVPLTYRAEFRPDGGFNSGVTWNDGQAGRAGIGQFSSWRERSILVPILARRKAEGYDTTVGDQAGRLVTVSDRSLTSRVVALSTGDHAEGERYRSLRKRILDIPVGTFLTESGLQPGLAISAEQGIALDRMGEGVSGTLKIITELCYDRPRVFAIEEPETDLHPGALRELLEEIAKAIDRGNQVFVSTHSDVVLRRLGSIDGARIYRADLANDRAGIPKTTYVPIDGPYERRNALQELGYEMTTPMGWLVLEESSMEEFLLAYLIPEFVPQLSALRTISAKGVSKVLAHVDDLYRFILYGHLSDPDKRVWSLTDGDDDGKRITVGLRELFQSWPPDRFRTLRCRDLEALYPERFASDVEQVRALKGWEDKGRAKGALVRKVVAWCKSEPDLARTEFADSAGHLIEQLKAIAEEVKQLDLPV